MENMSVGIVGCKEKQRFCGKALDDIMMNSVILKAFVLILLCRQHNILIYRAICYEK